jgi:hypothetical protein
VRQIPLRVTLRAVHMSRRFCPQPRSAPVRRQLRWTRIPGVGCRAGPSQVAPEGAEPAGRRPLTSRNARSPGLEPASAGNRLLGWTDEVEPCRLAAMRAAAGARVYVECASTLR